MENIQQVIDLMTLEKIDSNLYKGDSYVTPWERVFGGQVLGQSLHAAYQTVPEDRIAHSLHAYFILPGDCYSPIIYHVDTIRDGGSFTTRRVVAKQKGKAILNMAASFQLKQSGLEHQIDMPEVDEPEDTKSVNERLKVIKFIAPKIYKKLIGIDPNAFEFRPVTNPYSMPPRNLEPSLQVWFRAKEKVDVSDAMHQQLLACASDFGLLRTATLPHQTKIMTKKMLFASLDHAMWFHRDIKIDDWMLFVTDSPHASNSRGFTRGSIYTREGVLISSVTQEGLMRMKN